jgi:hypothetical protein
MLLNLCRAGTLLLVVATVGCQQPVKWTAKQEISPDPAKIGEKVTAYCTVTGDLTKVGWVSAVPIIAPEFAVELKDDGTNGDKKAGDGVFTAVGDVPTEAEPGEYEFECIVYDKNGDILRVPSFTILDKDGKVTNVVAPKADADGKKEETVEAVSIVILRLE